MSTFAAAAGQSAKPKPLEVVRVPLASFSAKHPLRPKAEIAVGIRAISEDEVWTARAEAERLATELHPDKGEDWLDARNDALMAWVVARATTDPNDATTPAWRGAETTVPQLLTGEAIRWLWDTWQRVRIQSSPRQRAADEDDLHELVTRLQEAEPLDRLAAPLALVCRKLLAFVLDQLRARDGA